MDTIILENKTTNNIDFVTDYTVVDIETTGLSPKNNEIIEISALKIRDNKVAEEFSSLVKPEQSVNSFINNLTGISDEMLENAPKIDKVLPEK